MSRMESFLVVSKDKKTTDEYTLNFCKEKGIADIDISTIEVEGSIGIADVRNLQKVLFFAPLRGKTKAVIIKNAEKLTVEAQNSLLKILEEPPNNTIIILTAENRDFLLPTVLSRCNIIYLSSLQMIESLTLPQGNIGQRLKLAESLAKNKNEAIMWIENAILALRQELISGKQISNTIISFQNTYVILKTTNTNSRLALENLFLNLSSL